MVLFTLLATLFVSVMTMLLGGNGRLRNVAYHLGMWDFTSTRIAEASQTHDIDILFLGSSHCYRSFDPRFYASKGLSSFNLGSSNQTPLQSEMLMRLFLDSLNPRIVIVEVHPDVLCLDGVESSVYLTNNMAPSWPMAYMALRTRNAKSVLTMLYSAAHNTFSTEFKNYSPPDNDSINTYVSGGYVQHCECHYSPKVFSPMDVDFPLKQIRALKTISRMLDKRHIPYLLVEVPDTRCYRDRYLNRNEFVDRMNALGHFRSVDIDQLDDSLHFFDAVHLNQDGVEIFQTYFFDSVLSPFMNENMIK